MKLSEEIKEELAKYEKFIPTRLSVNDIKDWLPKVIELEKENEIDYQELINAGIRNNDLLEENELLQSKNYELEKENEALKRENEQLKNESNNNAMFIV